MSSRQRYPGTPSAWTSPTNAPGEFRDGEAVLLPESRQSVVAYAAEEPVYLRGRRPSFQKDEARNVLYACMECDAGKRAGDVQKVHGDGDHGQDRHGRDLNHGLAVRQREDGLKPAAFLADTFHGRTSFTEEKGLRYPSHRQVRPSHFSENLGPESRHAGPNYAILAA